MKHNRRWSEETRMMVGGSITILIVFVAVVLFGKYGPFAEAPTKAAIQAGAKTK